MNTQLLKDLRLFTEHDVEVVIGNHLMVRVADHICTAAPQLFWRPYNDSPLLPSIHAQTDRAILSMYSFLCGKSLCSACKPHKKRLTNCAHLLCDRPMTDGLPIRGLVDLKNHRDVICHPLTHQLDRSGVCRFVGEDRHYRDVRAAIVWDIHRSMNQALTAAGEPPDDLEIDMENDTCSVLACVLSLCWKPGVTAVGVTELKHLMEESWRKDRIAFEKHPDGQFTKERTYEKYVGILKQWSKAPEDGR
jgi:hypothetical protein